MERIEKQNSFIESLEKEIIRIDYNCMNDYLAWGIQDFCNDIKSYPKKLDKQISVQSENNFKTIEGKLEDVKKQLKIVSTY